MSGQVKLLYFASLKEQLGLAEESIQLPADVETLTQLMQLLQDRGNGWADVFAGRQPMMMAINQQMAKGHARLQDGDEIAFFPPVTGG